MAENAAKVPRTGDTFRLKSGGPLMTLFDYDVEARTVHCGWFWRGRYAKERFDIGELEVVERAPRDDNPPVPTALESSPGG